MNLVQMSRSLRVYLSILPGTNALGAHYSSEPKAYAARVMRRWPARHGCPVRIKSPAGAGQGFWNRNQDEEGPQ
jgi:hypothetical protein